MFYLGRFFLSIVVTNRPCHTPTHTNTYTRSVNYMFSIHLFFKTFEYFKNILNCANSMDEKWNEHWRWFCLKRYAFQSICYETSVKKIFKLITDFRLDLNVSFGCFHALNTKIVNFFYRNAMNVTCVIYPHPYHQQQLHAVQWMCPLGIRTIPLEFILSNNEFKCPDWNEST